MSVQILFTFVLFKVIVREKFDFFGSPSAAVCVRRNSSHIVSTVCMLVVRAVIFPRIWQLLISTVHTFVNHLLQKGRPVTLVTLTSFGRTCLLIIVHSSIVRLLSFYSFRTQTFFKVPRISSIHRWIIVTLVLLTFVGPNPLLRVDKVQIVELRLN